MRRRRRGFTLVELLVVIAIIALLMGILMPALARVRQLAFRMVCGTNLSGIGKAMLIYANDYEDELPKAGGRNTVWIDTLPDWTNPNRQQAFSNGATISSCFYLLVKYAEVTPKSFLCKGDSDVSEFKLTDPDYAGAVGANAELIDVWNFGPDGSRHCSYSYHYPFDQYALTTSSEPGLAVAADPNPWQDESAARTDAEWDAFGQAAAGNLGSSNEDVRKGNAVTHQNEGQNVLFLDSHVNFEKVPYCAVNDDNIYTWAQAKGDRVGVRLGVGGTPGTNPARRQDSILVTDEGEASVRRRRVN